MHKNTVSFHNLSYLSILRIFAIFLVILLHASAIVVVKYGQIGNGSWMIANIFDSVARPSAALLFMVSGALLLPKTEPLNVFYRKRFIKILIPFFFWQLFYLFYSFSFRIEPFLDALKVKSTYYDLFFGYNYIHLWFIPIIIQIYLITPILRQWVSSVKQSKILQGLIIWGLIVLLNDLTSYIFGRSIITSNFVFGLGYFLLGYYLSSIKIKFKPKLMFLFLLLSLSITILSTSVITFINKSLFLYPYNYSSIQNCIASIFIFLLIKQINWKKKLSMKLDKIVSFVNVCCFGIYLIHLMLLELIIKNFPYFFFSQESKWYNYFSEIIILTVLTFLGSLAVVSLLKSNKITGKII